MLGLGGGVVVVLLGLTVTSSYLWGQMLQPDCREIARPDLSLQEMVDVKIKVDESERQGSAPIRLSGREATFLLREMLRMPMHVEIDDGSIHLEAALPYRDACYNVDYLGGAALDGGLAHLEPDRFVVGTIDVADWVGGTTDVATLGWVSPDAVEMLAHVESVHIEGGEIIVDIDDVRALR